ncbi:roundabout homolog 4 isoform 2-T2 [Clarias gariepinus]|uniref:roundabout homolog 1 isoform X2 n=1 Tax=Clarias gariepinus TaxID=13013 RepID=UPI00234C2A20|nr:roundabout homolog 1 isoform X2 [Clarias gariepinus]
MFRVYLTAALCYCLQGSRLRSDEVSPRIVHHPSDVVVRVGNPATLSCRAEGTPEPSIQWLRNGILLEPEKMDVQSRPIVLPEGSLFFLSVANGKKSQSHEAVYSCLARNNAGTAISRNASLYIAALKEEFRVQPSDVEVAAGEMAVMNCSSPVGHPEPNITWKKDGILVNTTDEHYTELNGKLIIAPARKQDSGIYICVASNIVGVKESRAARLTVLEKPVLLREPQDVSVSLGGSVHFFCETKGDPMPKVEWSREQGPLPNGRYLINPDQSLQIHYVTLQDAGRYTCTAVNDVGESKASAELFVEATDRGSQKDLHKELSALRISLENVTVLRTASNTSLVTWKLQSTSQPLHYLDGFEVLYRSLLPASSDWTAQKVAYPALKTHIGPLKRGYKYEFKVRPYGSELYGRESNTRHLRVPETAPSAPPQDVSITMPTEHNDTAQLSWEPPPHEAHNGIIQGYQVWCVQEEEQQYLNWTVDSGTHTLEIRPLQPGRVYWVRVAAVNGAGVGAQTSPYRLVIESKLESAPHHRTSLSMADVLALMREPVFIGSVGALLWCLMMATAACLYYKHIRPANVRGGHHKTGLYRIDSEDLIIKHRMAAPDSPWMSEAWKPDLTGEQCQSLWTQNPEKPDFRKTTLPITAKKDSSVPIVPDNCGVYGTFYVDLTGNNMKTFNSPGRCPKMPHCNTQQHNSETIRITQPLHPRSSVTDERQILPWKRTLPAQPNMGVRKESWEKNFKRELHAVKSAPLVPRHQQALMLRNTSNIHQHRLSQNSGAVTEKMKVFGSPRILQYSASLHLVDMLPTPPPLPTDDSVSSEEGSTRSTKLTVDAGSLQSVCAASTGCPSQHSPSYSRLSATSFCLSTTDHQDDTLSTNAHEQYLELSPNPRRHSTLSEKSPSLSRPFSPTPTFGYIYGPSERQPQDDIEEEQEAQAVGLQRTALRGTPSSCCSDWEGSLWNGWGSVSEGNTTSARTSIISSSDGSFMNDVNYARIMAMTAESMNETLSDFSPPGSPLSVLFPPRDCFGEVDPLAVWDWSTAWVEEMEAQYRSSAETPQNTRAELSHENTSRR